MSDEKTVPGLLLGDPDPVTGEQSAVRMGDQLEYGRLRPLRDGVPITGEVVTVEKQPDGRYSFTTEWTPEGATVDAGSHGGPARVATAAFRDGWDRVFGGKVGSA